MNARSTFVMIITLVVLSATTTSQATPYSWETAALGNWNALTAWAPDGSPGSAAGDTVTIDVTGSPYVVALNITPANALSAFTLDSSDAEFSAVNKTLTVDGPSNLADGSVTWQGSTWTGTGTLTNNADMTIFGASRISTGGFAQSGTMLIEGGSVTSHATLTADNGFDNSGTITMDSTHASYWSKLIVTSGTLTNTASGVITVNKTLAGAGSRTIAANLANNGEVNINADTLFSKTSGQYTNDGDFNIATDKTLTIDGSSQVFNQDSGTLDINGVMALATIDFNYNGGTITGTPTMTNVDLTIAPGATNGTSFLLLGTSSTLSGDVHAGQLLKVWGSATGAHATLTSAGGFSNSGTISLDSTHGSYWSNLVVTSGTLTNAALGVINVNKTVPGAGTRTIAANLANNGEVNINADTLFSKTSGQYTNDGDFNIATDKTLTISGSSQVFNQDSGTLDINGVMALATIDFNYNGGTITGTPTMTNVDLTIAPGATNGTSFLLLGTSSTLSGDVHAGQLLKVWGSATGAHATLTSAGGFSNSGTISLDSTHGSYWSNLVVTSGTLTNAALGVINVNKTVPGAGTRTIAANLANNGEVNINTDTLVTKASGQYTNDGDFNIATDKTLTISGSSQVFNQDSGTLDINGVMALATIDFNYNGGTITGTPTMTNVDLTIAPGTGGASFLLLGGSSTLSGDVQVGQVLNVQGDSIASHATLTSAGGFNNSGTITLDAAHASYQANLVVTSETLTNTASGVINVNETLIGPGTRTIAANLTNNGQVNINTDTTFAKASGQYTNDGDFNIAADKTLTIGDSSQVFNQDSGTLDIDGVLALTSLDFNYNGGTITGTPTMTNVDLTIAPGATNPASFLLRGASTLSGDVHAGQLLMVRGGSLGAHATLTSAGGFNNSGTITLDATQTGYYANLVVTSGTLTNTGVLDVNETTVGLRRITADLTNNGTVNINTNTTFNKAAGQYANNGDLNIALDKTLTISGSSVNFTNAPGGTIAGEGTLNLGTATFANDGRIAPGMSPGILAITGDVPFSSTAEFAVEIFGLTVGSEYDRLDVSGDATLGGNLIVIVDPGSFIPDPSDSFTIMTAGELSGEFDNTPGGVLALVQGTCEVIYDYDVDTITLTNFQNVPEPATMSLLALGGLALLRRRRRKS